MRGRPFFVMHRAMRIASLCLTLMLAACEDQRPPAPTAEESAALNDADAMLDDLAKNETP